jgi:DNA mismatch repair protein MutS
LNSEEPFVPSQLARTPILTSESHSDSAPAFTSDSVSLHSILFASDENTSTDTDNEAPEYFGDLNLDQVVEAITAGRDEYDLKPFFYRPLRRIEEIHYRQAVFHDLEDRSLFERVQEFAEEMLKMRSCMAQAAKFYYKFQKNALFVSAVEIYCAAVSRLTGDLLSASPQSLAFRSLRDHLARYTESSGFRVLAAESVRLRTDLRSVRYSLHIKGRRVTVGQYGDEPDLCAEVLRAFEKFRQGTSKKYQFRVSNWPEINHVEAAILDRVARLYPAVFSRLEEFPDRHGGFLDSVIAVFDREVQFYFSYIEFKRRVEQGGLPFCYPAVVTSKDRRRRARKCSRTATYATGKILRVLRVPVAPRGQ